jgi:hypothetical protein
LARTCELIPARARESGPSIWLTCQQFVFSNLYPRCPLHTTAEHATCTSTVLRGHHYRCALNPGNRSCKCEFCGKEANRDALEGHAKRCTKNPANQGLVCEYCDAKQLHREQKKRHEGKCKKKPEKDGAEEEDM